MIQLKLSTITLTLVAILALSSCTAPSDAERTLINQGYTNIDTHWSWYKFWGCSEDDTFRTSFAATSPAGKPVTGEVCKGFLKESIVRVD
jgi:hypothetical protein